MSEINVDSNILTIILIIIIIISLISIIILYITNANKEKSLNDKLTISQNKQKELENIQIKLPIINSLDLIEKTGINYNVQDSVYVQIPSFRFKSYRNGMTFSFWFRSNNSNNWARIFDFGNGADKNNIVIYILDNNLTFLLITSTPGDLNKYHLIKDINNNKLHHILWTINYNKTWNIYLDGKLSTTMNNQEYPIDIIYTSNYLGKSNWSNDPYLNGMISDFRLYNRILTNNEILDMYNLKQIQDIKKDLIIYNNNLVTYCMSNLYDVIVPNFNDDKIN